MLIDEKLWKEFAEPETKVALLGYCDANSDIVEVLEELIAKTNSYSELKNELTQFCNKRKAFIEFAYKNLPPS